MLGLVAMQVDIDVNEQCESGILCRFSEDAPLATSSSRQYICKNVSVSAITLPRIPNSVFFDILWLGHS